MVDVLDQSVTQSLDELHQQHQNNNSNQHDGRIEALIAVTDTDIAQTASADGACHGGIVHQRDQSDGQPIDDAR